MVRPPTTERPLHWVGSSKKDLLAFPGEVVDDLGYALSVVQHGGTVRHRQRKPGRVKDRETSSWSESIVATRSGRSTPCVSRKQSMSCTAFRRSHPRVCERQSRTSF